MRILYQQCGRCSSVWYLPKAACASCGAGKPIDRESGGFGVLRATTVVHRVPSPEFQDKVPFTIGLIDAEEGFVLMGHVEDGLEIGARVVASFRFAQEGCPLLFIPMAGAAR